MLLTAISTLALGAAQPAPVDYAPTGRWTVDAGENACVAARPFASADGKKLNLVVVPDIVGSDLLFLLDGDAAGRTPGRASDGAVVLQSGQQIRRIGLVSLPSGPGTVMTRLSTSRRPDTAPAYEADRLNIDEYRDLVTGSETRRNARMRKLAEAQQRSVGERTSFDGDGFTVAYSNDVQHRLATGSLANIFGALENCTKMIAEDYGVPADTSEPHLPIMPMSTLSRGFGAKHLAKMTTPVVNLEALLWIDGEGNLTQCKPVGAPTREIGEATCDELRENGSFLPARDAADAPVASIYHFRQTVGVPGAGRAR